MPLLFKCKFAGYSDVLLSVLQLAHILCSTNNNKHKLFGGHCCGELDWVELVWETKSVQLIDSNLECVRITKFEIQRIMFNEKNLDYEINFSAGVYWLVPNLLESRIFWKNMIFKTKSKTLIHEHLKCNEIDSRNF